jgi:hypothetical protein
MNDRMSKAARRRAKLRSQSTRCPNKTQLIQLVQWVLPESATISQDEFHGNVRWNPNQLAAQALVWSWQETKHVTDAFDHAQEVCDELGWQQTARSYTSLMNALDRYDHLWMQHLQERCQTLAEQVGGRFFRTDGWVLIGFDGSRTTAPRTISNERAFCAPNYGGSQKAKSRRKKYERTGRQRIRARPAHPQEPQAWITMLWHMGLRLPWTWRLGPSYASERDHVKDVLATENFPKNTLFCGDAGFVGYPLWQAILQTQGHFVVRVGGNVNLLSEQADVKQLGGGIVLCWPKGKMDAGEPPLRLRLVQVRVGKTKLWLLTSVLNARELTHQQLVRVYKMRWGIEIEFRGLKQTIDKHELRCRNSDRVLVELNWSLCGMAVAELLALREQLAGRKRDADPQDRSLANTLRALRKAMRNLSKACRSNDSLRDDLARAKVQRYQNRTDKKARYRPTNPDKKPLGEPKLRKLTASEREKLLLHDQQIAA